MWRHGMLTDSSWANIVTAVMVAWESFLIAMQTEAAN